MSEGQSTLKHYRGFTICKAFYAPSADRTWEYTHVDYDGPGDDRHGLAGSADECRAAIDEYLAEQIDLSSELPIPHQGYEP